MKTILTGDKSVKNFCLAIIILLLSFVAIHPNAYAATPIRGLAGDLWADTIIGQPSFSEITPYDIVKDKLFLSNGLTVDRSVSPGRLYVYDSGNSRVLGLDLDTCYATSSGRCQPQIVIGQPSFNTSACNGDSGFQNYPLRASASAATLCSIPEETNSVGESGAGASLAVDSNGALYVPDYGNSRVL
ncbi:MAG: hypothetical protein Q7S09_03450, partial [bacterium]|nr:hypothetical protein [bacterium]